MRIESLFNSKTIKVSLIASFISRFFGAIANILAVPLYIKIIGIESYGLIGLFASLQAITSLFDFGLSQTIIREFGRNNKTFTVFQKLSDLAKASEVVYFALSAIICIFLILTIPWMVNSWINLSELNPADVKKALFIGAIALSIQWPTTLYTAGLVGLQKQLLLSAFTTAFTLIRVVSTLMALYLVMPTLEVFFTVSLILSIVQVLSLRLLMWYQLPKANNWKLCIVRLYELRGFIGVMSAITICSILLTQLDKVILSNILSLKDFGVYTLVGALAGGIYITVSPIFSIIYPKFSELIKEKKYEDVLIFYHKSAQLLSLILIPIAATVTFFSENILVVWTGDLNLSSTAKLPLVFLVMGNVLNGMMNVPYALQLAYGRPKLALFNNIAAISFLVPSIWYLSKTYGISGGAIAWFLLNILYVLSSQYITHRKLFNAGLLKWYAFDVGLPFFVCTLVVFFFYLITPSNMSRFNMIFYVGVTFFVTFIAAVFSLSEMRPLAINVLKRYKLQ